MEVKFCGIRRTEDIGFVNLLRPDYIGMVFAPSRRQVTVTEAAALRGRLAPGIRAAGVFVNSPPEQVSETARAAGLDIIQLHGDEDADCIRRVRDLTGLPVWKAVRAASPADVRAAASLPADRILYDAFSRAAYGGTGQTADWGLLAKYNTVPLFFLAGGLNAENLEEAIEALHPAGVDLSGGIETGGIKDFTKMETIMKLIRRIS